MGDASVILAGSNICTASSATNVIDAIDTALDTINTERAEIGGSQSRFESVVSQLQIARENQEASRSRIMDTDFAEETARLTRAQILQQAGTAMLAQANALPNNVLSLLR
jgi:flagellin